MDVRLSAEQVALRDSAAQVLRDLGVHATGELDDPERSAKLGAAVLAAGWRDLRLADDGTGGSAGETADPFASGVEAAVVAEELARGLGDTPFIGPTLA